MHRFKILYDRYLYNDNPYLDWNKVELISDNCVIDYSELPKDFSEEKIIDLHEKVAVIKLNGGLGTTMNCNGPKSLIEIKDNINFLDLAIKQNKKLYLMNSFFTDSETRDYINDNDNIICFKQDCFPRILKETKKMLVDKNDFNKDYWSPLNHGDLLQSLYEKGILKKLMEDHVEYIFISNIDNTNATINYSILNNMIEKDIDFGIELIKKNDRDIKGGVLIKYNNKYKMFELAECPKNKIEEFQSINKFKYFNTNNIWIKVKAINELMEKDYLKDVDLIINEKKLKDGRDCIQLEYAIGSLVKFFDKVQPYLVDRSRFIPVKTFSDLELIRSDEYKINKKKYILEKR
jgi:UTP--glucose-1-phosphate uridylyltransferase